MQRSVLPLLLACITLVISDDSLADSAAVLPAGVSRAYADYYSYLPTTKRYNPDGDEEEITFPFHDAALDSSVLGSLAALDPFVSGRASIGDVAVEYDYDIDVLDVGYSYGLTDRLTIGFHIPYYWIRNDVDASFDPSTANVGLDPAGGTCCIPLAAGGQPLQTQDVQDLIGEQFGFDAIENWNREGIGDVEVGAKYRIFRRESSILAVTGGLRFPTGYADDPDDLTDVAWSYGNRALLFRLHYDYKISNLWDDRRSPIDHTGQAPGDVLLNTTFRYDYMFPDEKRKRVGDTPDEVFTNNRERVDRELGDLYNLEFSTRYQVTRPFALEATYRYSWKQKDRISGNQGFNYESLEANTDSRHEIVVLRASYSTLSAYADGESQVPLIFDIAYRERFSGEGPRNSQANSVLDTKWIVVGITVLF